LSITNCRQKFNFHQPSSNLPLHQKGAHSPAIQIYISLPQSFKKLSDNFKQFISTSKNYLYAHSYSAAEYVCNIFLTCSISKVLTCFWLMDCKYIHLNSIQSSFDITIHVNITSLEDH